MISEIRSDSPGRIRLSLENDSDRGREFDFGPTPPFSGYHGTHETEDVLLVLVPDGHEQTHLVDATTPTTTVDECWQLSEAMYHSDILQPLTLEENETVDREYTIMNAARNEECMPPGTYVFDGELGWTVSVNLMLPS